MPQRPLGLDMKLSQPNRGLTYLLNYDKTCLQCSSLQMLFEMFISKLLFENVFRYEQKRFDPESQCLPFLYQK